MENGIDNFLVPSLRKQIEENLGTEKLEKIEKRLIERHGINMVQAVKEFQKLDSVLREFFGPNADEIETKSLLIFNNFILTNLFLPFFNFLKNLCDVKASHDLNSSSKT